jgi:hypothetical protein
MGATRAIDLGEFNVSSTDRLRATITKDGAPWAGIDSVALTLEKPDRSTVVGPVAMTLESDAAGIWYYDTTTTDLTTAGEWTAKVRVTDGSVVKTYPYEISFRVYDQP